MFLVLSHKDNQRNFESQSKIGWLVSSTYTADLLEDVQHEKRLRTHFWFRRSPKNLGAGYKIRHLEGTKL
jgi:hypothetical protein